VIDPIPEVSENDSDLARRRATIFATFGFNELVRVPAGMEAPFRALRLWLDSWKGIGDIEAGMRRVAQLDLEGHGPEQPRRKGCRK
jgi:hypothetical protein